MHRTRRPKRLGLGPIIAGATIAVALLAAGPTVAPAGELCCGQPLSCGVSGPTATDCLLILHVAVGLRPCPEPACRCDSDDSGSVTAPDALICLRVTLGLNSNENCCGVTTTTSTSMGGRQHACCLPDGSCQEMREGRCGKMGGDWEPPGADPFCVPHLCDGVTTTTTVPPDRLVAEFEITWEERGRNDVAGYCATATAAPTPAASRARPRAAVLHRLNGNPYGQYAASCTRPQNSSSSAAASAYLVCMSWCPACEE